MPRTKNTEFFLKRLRELGDSAGNKVLRENLGWKEDKYFHTRQLLIEEGIVEIGGGKGGSVHLLGGTSGEEAPSKDESQVLECENDHYLHVVTNLEKQLKQDYYNAVVEQTAHQGQKATGGKWSPPDILAITVQKSEYIVQDEFILRSHEIKRGDMVDTDAVAEAAAHRRVAQLAYLIIVPHGDDKAIFAPTNIKRRNIEKEGLKSGVGLVLMPDYNVDSEIETAVEASNSNIDYRDVNSTIGLLFSEKNPGRNQALDRPFMTGGASKTIAPCVIPLTRSGASREPVEMVSARHGFNRGARVPFHP